MTQVTVTYDDETHVLVPRVPTAAMLGAGKAVMPVEYDFRSMRSCSGQYPEAIRMVVVGLAKLKDQVDPAGVWSAMLASLDKR